MVVHTCNLSMQKPKQEKQELKVHLDSKFKDHMGYMRPDLNTKTKQSSLFQFSVVRERLEKYTAERESRDQEPRKGEHVRGWTGRQHGEGTGMLYTQPVSSGYQYSENKIICI